MTYTYLIPQVPTDKDHIQVGAKNLAIKLQVKEGNSALDISSASIKNIIIEKPDDTIVTGSAAFFTSGSDGILVYYTSSSSILDQAGDYNAQAYIEMTGFAGYTTPVIFTVYENLPLTDINDIIP
jgi:hypothetical protein